MNLFCFRGDTWSSSFGDSETHYGHTEIICLERCRFRNAKAPSMQSSARHGGTVRWMINLCDIGKKNISSRTHRLQPDEIRIGIGLQKPIP
jgi:hypothetical protein